jgi:hypothetical protein
MRRLLLFLCLIPSILFAQENTTNILGFNQSNLFSDKNGTREIKDAFLQATAATNNQSIVSAVTGKKIVVLSLAAHSLGAGERIVFKSASGGANKRSYWVQDVTVCTSSCNTQEPFNPSGIFRTNTGEGLFVDNNSAAAVNISIEYIEFTP